MREQFEPSDPLDGDSVEEVHERVTDAVLGLDDAWRVTYVNERAEELLGRDEADLLGEVVWEAFPGAVDSQFQQEYEYAMETQEPVTFEEHYPPLDSWYEVQAYPSETGLTVHFRDVTERHERERALRRAYEVVADPELSFSEQIDALLSVVREAVGTEYATLSRVADDEYLFEAVDAPADADVEAGDTVLLETTNCERVVETERALVLEDVDRDAPALADRAGNAEWGISCYLGAPVTVDGEVYGTFCFYDLEARTEAFSDWEVTFVELLSDWVSGELERRRYLDRLDALNEINAVVREIGGAAVDRSTREEIERVACRRLAAADSYESAWVGEAAPATGDVQVRTAVGTSAADVPEGRSATAERALRTGELAVDRPEGVVPDPRRTEADDAVPRSVAAVPVVHAESVYGVLTVSSARRDAFEGEEASVLVHLGELLGHAIAATERKRALTSDTVVELELRVRDAFAEWDADAPPGSVVYEEVVPSGDGEFLVFGTASEEGVSAMDELVDAVPYWREVTRLGERADGVGFELALSEPPVLSTVAGLGGGTERAAIDDGDLRLAVSLPQGADVGLVLESVRDAYPGAEVVSKRQVTRQDDPVERAVRAFPEALTDRQRLALLTAYHAGFFEWPRESTGEDVADTLGVSPSTFHEHLRSAEHKLLDVLFEGASETDADA